MDPRILDALRDGATVITVNRRLARTIRAAFDRAMVDAGRASWPSADVLPWSAFVHRQWSEHADRTDARVMLGPDQVHAVWESIVAGDPRAGQPSLANAAALVHTGGAAREAERAWILLRRWRRGPDALRGGLGEDARAFRDWAHAFDRQCGDRGWIDPSSASVAIADMMEGGRLEPPGRVLLAGFDALAPVEQARLAVEELLNLVLQAGVDQSPAPSRPSCNAPTARRR